MAGKVIIIGGGAAGYTAAIYTARAGMEPILIVGHQPGGQLTITTAVDNFPGFPDGIQGPELMERVSQQAKKFGTRIIEGIVEKVEFIKSPFNIHVDGKRYTSKAVIVASGASANWLQIPSEQALIGKGVSGCATCDGFFFKGADVVVVGGGDTAMEDASYLTHVAKSVKIIHRRSEFRASKAMQERVKANPKISFILDSVVEEIKDVKAGKVTGVVLKNIKSQKFSEIKCDGVFIAIGHKPNTKIFEGVLKLDERGYVVVKPGTTLTSVKGVFAAGDVADPVYRQAITAAGTGCMAALDAERFLAHA